MNLLVSSKLCISSQRPLADYLPGRVRHVRLIAIVVCDARGAREETADNCEEQLAPVSADGLRQVDIATPFGLRRDFRLDGETLYSQYLSQAAA